MLNKEFVKRKVGLIQKDLGKLAKLGKFTLDEILADYLKTNALDRLLEKIINRAIDINQHIISEKGKGSENVRGYEETFYALADIGVYRKDFAEQIAPSAGLRNRIVHEYDDLNEEILFKSVKKGIPLYVKYCDFILKYIN